MLSLLNTNVIGITGMSGAGKSTVCRELGKICGNVIDCDVVAREVAQNRDFPDELAQRFGSEILNYDGTLNRAETARLIFSDEEKRILYNQIIFPYIIYEIMQRIKASKGKVLLDAPTLFEAKLDMICTKIVSVTADFDICAERIAIRDGITSEQARARLKSQNSAEFFKHHSDYTIENNASHEELVKQAHLLADRIDVEI